jgi:hypothetical protein
MNQQSDRCRIDGFTACCQLLKRHDRRVTGIEIAGFELDCQRSDDATRPAIQRMRSAVTGFRGLRKYGPLQVGSEPEQNHRSLMRSRRQRVEFAHSWVERTSHRKTDTLGSPLQPFEQWEISRRKVDFGGHFVAAPCNAERTELSSSNINHSITDNGSEP